MDVVIVSFRCRELLRACLASLHEHAPAAGARIWVVDNASGDGSAGRIRAAVPRARVIESDVNRGFAGGCNLGAAPARGGLPSRW